MKKFYDKWKAKEINDYIAQFNVLVLFSIVTLFDEVEIVIHGNFKTSKKKMMLLKIISKYGGLKLTDVMCAEINEYAERWFNRNISKESSRIINFGKRREK